MTERLGVAAAVLSSTLGGLAAVATPFVVGTVDPVTIAAFRFGGGFVLLLPIALALRSRWPRRRDWIGVALLGLMFFALFFICMVPTVHRSVEPARIRDRVHGIRRSVTRSPGRIDRRLRGRDRLRRAAMAGGGLPRRLRRRRGILSLDLR